MIKSGELAVVSLLVLFSLGSSAGFGPQIEQQARSTAASTTSAAAQKIIQQLVAGQFEKVESQFDSQMAAALPPGKLAAGWPGLILQAGTFQSVIDTQVLKVSGLDVVRMECKFQNVILDATVAFDPDGKIAGLGFRPHQVGAPPWTPPAYANQNLFSEQPLTLVNGKFELPGKLTMPKGDGPFRAVVLVHGSGPHDEDETVGPNKPFEDLAWGLASRGIAVFRYAKRTQQYGSQSADDLMKVTVEDEVISDARAAVALITNQPKIDPQQVFLVGHSLGAYLAPRIATGDPQIAGIAMLGANTRPIEQVALDQIHYLASANGKPSEDEQKRITAVEESVKQIESPDLKADDTVPFIGATTYGAYWLDLRQYDPLKTAEKLKIPISIMQGGRDYQVTPANFEAWSAPLAKRNNVTLRIFPDLNHLFMTGEGRSTPSEYEKPGHVSEDVIDAIAVWVLPSEKPGTLKKTP
ncbi:MAG: alpha/beta fold hydrolase [Candidatus Acidiferrales bacterium]